MEEFHVHDDWATYRKFIEGWRRKLQDGDRRSHGCPVLSIQYNSSKSWFEIVLRTKSHAIRLKIRRDNIYLDGFRPENSQQWFEFGRSGRPHHLINGSTFLGFDGGYNKLESVGRRGRNQINLGQEQLMEAVNRLARTKKHRDREMEAQSLIVVIQMICESIRFRRISEHLAGVGSKDGLRTPDWMVALENCWGDLSAALLRADADAAYSFQPPQPEVTGIRTIRDAADALGILLPDRRRILGDQLVMRPLGAKMFPSVSHQGRPLVEVFWVRVDDIDEEKKPIDLYGTITVTDGLGPQYIYNRTRDDPESIHRGQNALLTGPARAISAYGSFTIDVDLKGKSADSSPDDEVSRGRTSWNVYNTANVYDESMLRKVDGRCGSVMVNYVVWSEAAVARVGVSLVDGKGANPAHVYGRLVARIGGNESMLFRKASNEHIDIRPRQPIPLSRSIVAVPRFRSLRVEADLYDHDDYGIAKGTAGFSARPGFSAPGTSEKKTISGKCGKIGVKITWAPRPAGTVERSPERASSSINVKACLILFGLAVCLGYWKACLILLGLAVGLGYWNHCCR